MIDSGPKIIYRGLRMIDRAASSGLLSAGLFMHRVVGDLALAAAVDGCLASTTLLKPHLATAGRRSVQLIVCASGVSAADEVPGELHVHPFIHN